MFRILVKYKKIIIGANEIRAGENTLEVVKKKCEIHWKLKMTH